jgi:hypothetical protein
MVQRVFISGLVCGKGRTCRIQDSGFLIGKTKGPSGLVWQTSGNKLTLPALPVAQCLRC